MGNIVDKLKQLFSGKKLEVVLIGLENSGKTTITQRLSMDKVKNRGPTLGLDIQTFQKGNVTLNLWDLGGQVQYRTEWAQYAQGTDTIIFVVDTTDVKQQERQNKKCKI